MDRLGIQMGVGTRLVRLGIYRATSDTNLYPDALVVDAGVTGAAPSNMTSVVTDVTLQSNTLYWMAFVSDAGTGTYDYLAQLSPSWSVMGVSGTSFTTEANGVGKALTFGPLPSTFPSGAAVEINVPLVHVRYSA